VQGPWGFLSTAEPETPLLTLLGHFTPVRLRPTAETGNRTRRPNPPETHLPCVCVCVCVSVCVWVCVMRHTSPSQPPDPLIKSCTLMHIKAEKAQTSSGMRKLARESRGNADCLLPALFSCPACCTCFTCCPCPASQLFVIACTRLQPCLLGKLLTFCSASCP
jgi:hypothetical protein